MAQRTLACAIEDLPAWHPALFPEAHVIACVDVLSKYSPSPALLEVDCENIDSRWLGDAAGFGLELSWSSKTAAKVQRLRATIQAKPRVEFAAIALALILGHRVLPLGQLDATAYGDRADYRSLSLSAVLEISGTETLGELGRRHREKVAQAVGNRLGWDAYVIVCAFSDRGHRIRFSGHRAEETTHGNED
jgi:hypothetical protein